MESHGYGESRGSSSSYSWGSYGESKGYGESRSSSSSRRSSSSGSSYGESHSYGESRQTSESYYSSVANAEKYVKKLENEIKKIVPRNDRERQLLNERRKKIAQLKALAAKAKKEKEEKAKETKFVRQHEEVIAKLEKFIEGLQD